MQSQIIYEVNQRQTFLYNQDFLETSRLSPEKFHFLALPHYLTLAWAKALQGPRLPQILLFKTASDPLIVIAVAQQVDSLIMTITNWPLKSVLSLFINVHAFSSIIFSPVYCNHSVIVIKFLLSWYNQIKPVNGKS